MAKYKAVSRDLETGYITIRGTEFVDMTTVPEGKEQEFAETEFSSPTVYNEDGTINRKATITGIERQLASLVVIFQTRLDTLLAADPLDTSLDNVEGTV